MEYIYRLLEYGLTPNESTKPIKIGTIMQISTY
jgi:hypothetical protein